ncbi:MAG: 5'/3'-nucleotidase SurE [Desulfobacteraceae bacterium]|nr:5'/3'-nucleotidase SurE [Desulfobacteraceae bacterium]MBC2758025.1 5'/3'-nucleotidase SurE [Desulfobacteraceae bacterium]
MKIVLTNDDGHDEPGLTALYRGVLSMGEVIIVAPRDPQSSAGHRVTLKEPIRVEKISSFKYVVDGSPADCTRLALKHFAPSADWLIAGINPGANLGTDVYQSGTVAAAREAAILGYKAIAISQYIAPDQKINWEVTGQHVTKILSRVMKKTLNHGQFWNINIPHPVTASSVLEYQFCRLDKNSHEYTYQKNSDQYQYTGIIHNRPRTTGKDVDVCFGGQISITLLDI